MKSKIINISISLIICLFFSQVSINHAVGNELTETEIANTERFLKYLHEQKKLLETHIEPQVWLIPAYIFPVIPVSREQAINAITMNYYKELINRGLTFNKEELKGRINKLKNKSDQLKLGIKEEIRRINEYINKENSILLNAVREQQQVQHAPIIPQINSQAVAPASSESMNLSCFQPYSKIEYRKSGKGGVGFPKYRYSKYRLKFGFKNDCKEIVRVNGTVKYTTGHGTNGLNTSKLVNYTVGEGAKREPYGTHIYASDRVGPVVFEFQGDAEIDGIKYPLLHKGQVDK